MAPTTHGGGAGSIRCLLILSLLHLLQSQLCELIHLDSFTLTLTRTASAQAQQITLCIYNNSDACTSNLSSACTAVNLGECFYSSAGASGYYKVVQTGAEYTMTVSPTSTCEASFVSYTGALSTCISASSVSCYTLFACLRAPLHDHLQYSLPFRPWRYNSYLCPRPLPPP